MPNQALVAGDPARVLLGLKEVARRNRPAWRNWPSSRIEAAVPALAKGAIAALEAMARARPRRSARSRQS